jgi:hypothetical protein
MKNRALKRLNGKNKMKPEFNVVKKALNYGTEKLREID